MNRYIEGGLVAAVMVGFVVALSAEAASFDCGKASTKVEHIICDKPGLSKLDEELAASYSRALKDQIQAEAIKLVQKQWMKERDRCADLICLQSAYLVRIEQLRLSQETTAKPYVPQQITSNTENYKLLMSKDDELCNHMMQLFNDDLKKYGWNGDEHQEEHEEFKQVSWQPARFSFDYYGHTEYTAVEGALFDFNNDGKLDFVVRWKSSLSNARADLLFMFDAEMFKRADKLNSQDFGNAKDQIYLAGNGYFYDQKNHLSEMDTYPRTFDPRVLEPFIYRGTSYLVMRNLFEYRSIRDGYAVISKYGGGKFAERDVTGKMEDICYFKRADAIRAR